MNLRSHVSICAGLVLLFGLLPLAAGAAPDFGTGYLVNSDLPADDLRDVAVNLINILLSALGVIFLLLVLYGGFLWMVAGGSDDQAAKGRKVIGNAIVGLLVVFLAFAITTFVFNLLFAAA